MQSLLPDTAILFGLYLTSKLLWIQVSAKCKESNTSKGTRSGRL